MAKTTNYDADGSISDPFTCEYDSNRNGGPLSGIVAEYEYYLDRVHKLSTNEGTVTGELPNRNLRKKKPYTYPVSSARLYEYQCR